MAKRKRLIPRQSVPWTAEEITILYGWLDYSISIKYSEDDFWNTIGAQLEEPGSIHYETPQVKSKLHYDYNHLGYDGTTWKDVFISGSKCFGLSTLEKADIETAQRNFREGNRITTTPAQRLRSTGTNHGRFPSRAASSHHNGSPHKGTKKPISRGSALVGKGGKRTFENGHCSVEIGPSSDKRSRTTLRSVRVHQNIVPVLLRFFY